MIHTIFGFDPLFGNTAVNIQVAKMTSYIDMKSDEIDKFIRETGEKASQVISVCINEVGDGHVPKICVRVIYIPK